MWAVGILFTIVGAVIAFFLPGIITPERDRETSVLLVRILGGVFLLLGLICLAVMLVDTYLARRNPQQRDNWFYWS